MPTIVQRLWGVWRRHTGWVLDQTSSKLLKLKRLVGLPHAFCLRWLSLPSCTLPQDADGKLKWSVPTRTLFKPQSFEHDLIILNDAGVSPSKLKETGRPQVPVDTLLTKRMFRQALLTGTSPDKTGDSTGRPCELCRRCQPQPFPLTCAICLSTTHQSSCLLACLKASGAKERIMHCLSTRTLPTSVPKVFNPRTLCHVCTLIMFAEESAFEERRQALMLMPGSSEDWAWEVFLYIWSSYQAPLLVYQFTNGQKRHFVGFIGSLAGVFCSKCSDHDRP